MTAKLISIIKSKSNYGGSFFIACFKEIDTGLSARTFIYPKCINFLRWQKLFDLKNQGKEIFLDKLRYFNEKKRLVDADSDFSILN